MAVLSPGQRYLLSRGAMQFLQPRPGLVHHRPGAGRSFSTQPGCDHVNQVPRLRTSTKDGKPRFSDIEGASSDVSIISVIRHNARQLELAKAASHPTDRACIVACIASMESYAMALQGVETSMMTNDDGSAVSWIRLHYLKAHQRFVEKVRKHFAARLKACNEEQGRSSKNGTGFGERAEPYMIRLWPEKYDPVVATMFFFVCFYNSWKEAVSKHRRG